MKSRVVHYIEPEAPGLARGFTHCNRSRFIHWNRIKRGTVVGQTMVRRDPPLTVTDVPGEVTCKACLRSLANSRKFIAALEQSRHDKQSARA